MGSKYLDTFWDFYGVNTKEFTHGFHTYPAMMIPQIARELINRYGNEKTKLIFDPYMGSGTTLVEAKVKGIKSIGTDLNPLARLIGKVKTTNINLKLLEGQIAKFEEKISHSRLHFEEINPYIPTFSIRDNWFKEKTLKELGIIKEKIEEITNQDIKDFFYVAFTETIRTVSYQRNGEFKLYAIEQIKRENYDPATFEIMIKNLGDNFNGIKQLNYITSNKTKVIINDFNTSEGIDIKYIKENSVDLVVTSPPYGDSRTTVAYGQFSRLANEWMEFKDAIRIDKILMGGEKSKKSIRFGFEPLDTILNTIQKNDLLKEISKAREPEIVSFYKDYRDSINNVSKVLKHGSYACYVVGNRRVHDIELPTDEITKFFFEQNNFVHIETIIRNIPGKRMPSRTAPSNIAGESVSTMNNEYIVIMKKIKKGR